MTIVCWGNQAKSASDTQRIEQAIQAYVEDHNEDVNAHQLEGSALYMHRVNEKLDHLEGSVSSEFFVNNKIFALGTFESFDGWTTSGDCDPGVFGARIQPVSALDDDVAFIYPNSLVGATLSLDPAKNPFFQTTVLLASDEGHISYFGLGAAAGDEAGHFIGFKIQSDTVYACWWSDGVEYKSEIAGITVTGLHCYRVRVDSENSQILFYVDGVLKYTASANFPDFTATTLFFWYIENTGDAKKTMYICDWVFQQDRS